MTCKSRHNSAWDFRRLSRIDMFRKSGGLRPRRRPGRDSPTSVRAEKNWPQVDVAEARQLRRVPAGGRGCRRRRAGRGRSARPWRGRGTPVLELAAAAQVVHVLPDQVRRVEVEAEAGRAKSANSRRQSRGWRPGSCRPATRRRLNSIGQCSMPTRTPCSSGELDERLPDLQQPRPVVVDRFRPVAADERVDHADAERVRPPR